MNATGEGVNAPLMNGHAPHDASLHIINELACMSPLDYAQAKKARAAELGLSLGDLEKTVRAARKKPAKAASAEDDDGKPSQADTLVSYACEAAQFYSNPNNEDETYALVQTDGHRECWLLKSTGLQGVAALPVLQPHRPRSQVRRFQSGARYARCQGAFRWRIGAGIPAAGGT